MTDSLALLALAGLVVWGVTAAPGRPFTWTMFSGSSKPFLWTRSPDGSALWATTDALGLAPDAHYLRAPDLPHLADAGLPALDGFIIGSRGSWTVAHDGATGGLVVEPLSRDDDLARLAAALRRLDEPAP